ncbi:hypothetical protein [Kitasatospora sp. MBT66]|uniref:hypothetical protein n=1 Tax=Kitasatospora sp. MBT66 TaxID=1444769 RepID=UPI0011EA7091|nr:hypothetical protein [Kitasatospora sp. MBT66]
MSAAALAGRPEVPADAGSLALARLLAGPSGIEDIARALGWSPARVKDGTAHLQQVTGARDRTELVADYAWAGHLTARHLGAHDLEAVHRLPADKRLLLRLSAGGGDDRTVGAEIGASAATVRQRRDVLLGALEVATVHQAVGLGCLAGVVRRADMPRRFGPAAAPVADHLRLPVALALRQLGSSGRALVMVPRREQSRLAAAAAARTGGLRRVLVLTEPGEYWQHDLEVLAAADLDTGQVLAVLGRAEAARLPLPPGVEAATNPSAVRAAAGTTLPAVFVTTPQGLPALTRLHREGRWPLLDLAVVFDAHLPGIGDPTARPEECPPADGVLRLTSAPRFTTADRTGRGGCRRAVTGALTAAVPLRRAAELELMRHYRLAATAIGRSAQHAAPAQLVADLVRAHALRRILVHSGPRDARSLAVALARIGLDAEVLPARDRGPVLARFADDRAPRVLVTDRPLPSGLGADALVHTSTGAPTERTAAVVEAALTPARPGEGPLRLVSADRADENWAALAELTGALAALDPQLAKDLADARDRHAGHAGLELALPLPAGTAEQRARAVCAWADTTWDEEMKAAATRAPAAVRPRRDAVSPSGRPLSTFTLSRPAARTAALRHSTGGAA